MRALSGRKTLENIRCAGTLAGLLAKGAIWTMDGDQLVRGGACRHGGRLTRRIDLGMASPALCGCQVPAFLAILGAAHPRKNCPDVLAWGKPHGAVGSGCIQQCPIDGCGVARAARAITK